MLRAKAAEIKTGAHDQVNSFCALLERHIRTEERQLFVLAENRMKPAEMAELGRQIKSAAQVRGAVVRRRKRGERRHQPEKCGAWGSPKDGNRLAKQLERLRSPNQHNSLDAGDPRSRERRVGLRPPLEIPAAPNATTEHRFAMNR